MGWKTLASWELIRVDEIDFEMFCRCTENCVSGLSSCSNLMCCSSHWRRRFSKFVVMLLSSLSITENWQRTLKKGTKFSVIWVLKLPFETLWPECLAKRIIMLARDAWTSSGLFTKAIFLASVFHIGPLLSYQASLYQAFLTPPCAEETGKRLSYLELLKVWGFFFDLFLVNFVLNFLIGLKSEKNKAKRSAK